MTRELQATMKPKQVRAWCNAMFFNKLECLDSSELNSALAAATRFAQACQVLLLKQQVSIVEHRPAERPGAD